MPTKKGQLFLGGGEVHPRQNSGYAHGTGIDSLNVHKMHAKSSPTEISKGIGQTTSNSTYIIKYS